MFIKYSSYDYVVVLPLKVSVVVTLPRAGNVTALDGGNGNSGTYLFKQ